MIEEPIPNGRLGTTRFEAAVNCVIAKRRSKSNKPPKSGILTRVFGIIWAPRRRRAGHEFSGRKMGPHRA
jgi:hypothetical protein